MHVLLTHGYHLALDEHEGEVMKPYPPLGLLYISAYLKKRGLSVSVFDATFRAPEDFTAALERERPSVVGIYCNLMTKRRVLDMVREAKAAGVPVVLGGPDPPFHAEEYLARGADAIVIGEGEEAMEELALALSRSASRKLHSVSGIVFRDDAGSVVRTEPRAFLTDLDVLPMPDRDAIDMEPYLRVWKEHHGRSSLSLICARGCAYHCDWCSHAVYGKTHRRRSPSNVARELEELESRYRPDQVWYADDVFTIKPSWLFAYAEELERRGLHVPFECISRADRLSEPIVDTLARIGCFRIWIGSESGSQKILDAMRRGVTVEQVQAATRLCQSRGIEVGMFIMVGYEGEEEEDLRATVEHLKKAGPDVFLTTVAYPIKGTGYYEKVRDRVGSSRAWEHRSDRDLVVAGRHSHRYYEAAMKWIVSEVGFHRELHRPGIEIRRIGRLAKRGARWATGRLQMALRAREVEG